MKYLLPLFLIAMTLSSAYARDYFCEFSMSDVQKKVLTNDQMSAHPKNFKWMPQSEFTMGPVIFKHGGGYMDVNAFGRAGGHYHGHVEITGTDIKYNFELRVKGEGLEVMNVEDTGIVMAFECKYVRSH